MHVPCHIRMQHRVSIGSLENVYRTDTKPQSTGSVTRRYHWGTPAVLWHAALVRSRKNGLQPLWSTTETMPPNDKTITAAAMTTSRITSLRELLHYGVLEKFVNHLYDRTSSFTSVNEMRELFKKKQNKQEASPAFLQLERHLLIMPRWQCFKVDLSGHQPVWRSQCYHVLLGDDSLQAVSGYLTGQLLSERCMLWSQQLVRRGRGKCVKAKLACTGLCNCTCRGQLQPRLSFRNK